MTGDRNAQITRLLDRAGWQAAAQTPLAGDASARRYLRLTLPDGRRAILMDADPARGEDVTSFLQVGEWLAAQSLSVPDILARDVQAGLLLIEDFGDGLLARRATAHPSEEAALYESAAKALVALQEAPGPGYPPYRTAMPDLAGLAIDWYAPEADAHRGDLTAAMAAALDAMPAAPSRFVHRDYHAENLVWLPSREGPRRIGLLDFQDAMTGPGEYDLASLVHDPRRAVSDRARDNAIRTYIDGTGASAADVATRIAVCSAQRALRILGVFARLCLRDGKLHYPSFIPATWAVLQRDLSHPALHDLRGVVARALPAPDAARLSAIKARAGQMSGAPSAQVVQ
ncbi:MAG: phosphotransferase [Pseudomonadota bacterium]